MTIPKLLWFYWMFLSVLFVLGCWGALINETSKSDKLEDISGIKIVFYLVASMGFV